MARRHRLSPADYSHIRGRPVTFVLDQAIEYSSDTSLARIASLTLMSSLVISLFEGIEVLRYGDVMDRLEAVGMWQASRIGTRWSPGYAAERGGAVIGFGVKAGVLVEERTDEGERCWRIVTRDPAYTAIPGIASPPTRILKSAVMTPKEAAEIAAARAAWDKHKATLAKREATIARKYAVNVVRPEIVYCLAALGRLEIPIPAEWHDFVPADIRERWPSVSHAMGLLFDVHLDWPRERQDEWLSAVKATWGWLVHKPELDRMIAEAAAEAAADGHDYRTGVQKFEAGEMGGLWGAAAQAAAATDATIPDDDLDALADLA